MPILLACGSNAQGQLANGSLDDSYRFQPSSFAGHPSIPTGRHVVDVTAGANHTLCLLESYKDGRRELWGSGDGSKGQLGPRSSSAVFEPVDLPIPDGYALKIVAAAWETSYVVLSRPDESDVVLSMGGNDFGDLGVGAAPPKSKEVHTIRLSESFGEINVESIAAGPHHLVLVLRSPERQIVVGWGTSRHGQLGRHVSHGSKKSIPFLSTPHIVFTSSPGADVTSVALGSQHTILLLSSGRVVALGSDKKSQYSGIESIEKVKEVGCTWNGTFAKTPSGLFTTGVNSKGQLGYVEGGKSIMELEICKLACGSEHILALVDREVWAWGWNEHGNLGLGHTEDVRIPERIHTRDDGEVTGIWAGCGTSWIAVA